MADPIDIDAIHERCCSINGEPSLPCDCRASAYVKKLRALLSEFAFGYNDSRAPWCRRCGMNEGKHAAGCAVADAFGEATK